MLGATVLGEPPPPPKRGSGSGVWGLGPRQESHDMKGRGFGFRFRVSDLGFQGFRVQVFGFRDLPPIIHDRRGILVCRVSGFRVSWFVIRASCFRVLGCTPASFTGDAAVSCFVFRVSGFGSRSSRVSGFRVSGFGFHPIILHRRCGRHRSSGSCQGFVPIKTLRGTFLKSIYWIMF